MNTSILDRKRRQTLTLEQRAAGTHRPPPTPPATAARKSPAPPLTGARPRGAPPLTVRDAEVRVRAGSGHRRQATRRRRAPAWAERVRWRGGRWRRQPRLLRGRHGRRLRGRRCFAWREKGESENVLGFRGGGAGRVLIPRGTRPAVGSDLTARSGRRRSGHIRPKSEPSAGRFSGPGPRCALGVGEARAERAAGQFSLLGRLHSGDFQCFFSEAFS